MAIKKIYFSLILPVFNEGLIFEANIKSIYKILGKLKKSWEVIFVEDKSTDNTSANVQKLLPNLKNTQLIYHNNNQGRGKSISDGIKASRGSIVGFLDVDLEISASYIPIFIEEIEKGYDMVVGKRFYEQRLNSITRVLTSRGYALIVKLILNIPVEDTETGFKFFRRDKILPILAKVKDKKWFWDTEICVRTHLAGLKIEQVPVLFIRRYDKKSTVRLIPDIWDYLASIIRFKSELSKS